MFSLSGLPPSSVQVPGGHCHNSYSSVTLLNGGSLASHLSMHIGRPPSMLSNHKRPCHGCFSQLGAQVCAGAAFNPLAAQRYVLHRQGYSSSVCPVAAGVT